MFDRLTNCDNSLEYQLASGLNTDLATFHARRFILKSSNYNAVADSPQQIYTSIEFYEKLVLVAAAAAIQVVVAVLLHRRGARINREKKKSVLSTPQRYTGAHTNLKVFVNVYGALLHAGRSDKLVCAC